MHKFIFILFILLFTYYYLYCLFLFIILNLLLFILFYPITYDPFCSIELKVTMSDRLGFMFV